MLVRVINSNEDFEEHYIDPSQIYYWDIQSYAKHHMDKEYALMAKGKFFTRKMPLELVYKCIKIIEVYKDNPKYKGVILDFVSSSNELLESNSVETKGSKANIIVFSESDLQ